MPTNSENQDHAASADRVLLRRARRGDRAAFSAFYEKHRSWMLAYAHSLTREWSEAEDVVQEVFCRLVDAVERVRVRSSAKAYLATAVRNDVVSRRRRRASQRRVQEQLSHEQAGDEGPRSGSVDEAGAGVVAADAYLDVLPEDQREVMLLWALGFTAKQVAMAIDVPHGTAKTRLRSAQARLREVFGDDGAEGVPK